MPLAPPPRIPVLRPRRALRLTAHLSAHEVLARPFWHRPIEILAAQQPHGQWRPRQQPNVLVMRNFGQIGIVEPAQKTVLVLHAGNPREAVFVGHADELHHAPRAVVRHTEGADFPRLNLIVDRPQALEQVFQRICRVLLSVRAIVPMLLKVIAAALWPVKLIEIDIVRLQPLQTALDRERESPWP